MRRKSHEPRAHWQGEVEQLGLLFHTTDGPNGPQIYWDESAHYELSAREVDALEAATYALFKLYTQAAEVVIRDRRYAELAIPETAIPAIERSWEEEPPVSVYGRFDLAYDGIGKPKLLEFNADTPTALLEQAVVQWQWLQALHPDADQFNSTWERLIEHWKELRSRQLFPSGLVHFAHSQSLEDQMTVTALRDTAQQAGLQTDVMLMEHVGWDSTQNRFVDPQGRPIDTLFKLYPWEWMVHEDFGARALDPACATRWIEPAWKLLWSNKAMLAILWELFPGSPYLLETYRDRSRGLTEYVRKPVYSREGADIMMKRGGTIVRSPQEGYGEEGHVFQAIAPIPEFDGNYPVFGSWVINGFATGIGIRESTSLITDNLSRFVPHLFR